VILPLCATCPIPLILLESITLVFDNAYIMKIVLHYSYINTLSHKYCIT
jgi:hypothetical protein